MERLKEWLAPGTPRWDVVTTLAFLVLLTPVTVLDAIHEHTSTGTVVALTIASSAPLCVRSRWPLAAVAGTAAATIVAMVLVNESALPPLALAVALYSYARRSDRRTTWRTGAATAVVVSVTGLLLRPGLDQLPKNLGLLAWTCLAVAVGDATRSRRELLASAMERAERAERTKEEEARRRVTEERMRIARELHDVVAHHITLVNAQAGVAHHLMKTDATHAYEALERIRDTSRAALDELRATVGLLRSSGDETAAPREPAPGLADLGPLVESFHHSGLEVVMERSDDSVDRPVPALTDLTAFRIIQEALTNTHKHAGQGAVAHVRVEVAPDAVRISVVDDGGRGAARSSVGTGHGMIGMQERAKALGGTFAAGPRPGRGFRVDAELPTHGSRAGAGAGSVEWPSDPAPPKRTEAAT